jgi:hypothetical protein
MSTRTSPHSVPVEANDAIRDQVTRAELAGCEDDARYLLADWEWYVPLDRSEKQFANKQRIRGGMGSRRSFEWRFEVLYIWTRSETRSKKGSRPLTTASTSG